MICVRTKSKYGVEQKNYDGDAQTLFLLETAKATLEYADTKLKDAETVKTSKLYIMLKDALEEKDADKIFKIYGIATVFCVYDKDSERITKIKVVGKGDNTYYNRTVIDVFDTLAEKSIGMHMAGIFSSKGDEYFEDFN